MKAKGGENMKKKKQQTRNLIILAVVTVGIVLGLWAMNSKFSLNSKADYNDCKPTGVYALLNPNSCIEFKRKKSDGMLCGYRNVEMKYCTSDKYKPKPTKTDCKPSGEFNWVYPTNETKVCKERMYDSSGTFCGYRAAKEKDCQ